LTQKYPKSQVSRNVSLTRKPSPCKTIRTTGCNYFARLRSLIPKLLQKLAMPLPTHKATIVLPAFARNLPADGDENKLS
jgi:hypothetical protein